MTNPIQWQHRELPGSLADRAIFLAPYIKKTKSEGIGGRQPPNRSTVLAAVRAGGARGGSPFSKLQNLLLLRFVGGLPCPAKGDIWDNSGHYLHLTNQGDPGIFNISIHVVTSDGAIWHVARVRGCQRLGSWTRCGRRGRRCHTGCTGRSRS